MPSRGHLALILHAHLPFVRHPEHAQFLEEDWLCEAITETYIPLLVMTERLLADGVPFRLTISLSPPLCAMLGDELLRARYAVYLDRAIALAEREIERPRAEAQLRSLAVFYRAQWRECQRRFNELWQRDLLAVFRQFQEAGALEIATSAATHAFLPLLAHAPESARAQVLIARDQHREIFGRDPVGFWLPECGYAEGVDALLQEANLRWFVVDTHGLLAGTPRPRFGNYAPCYTRAGPAAFARDRETSRQVWSAHEGYPGDPAYRDFYRDAGFDRPLDYLGFETPQFTGLKYHRITGATGAKQLYDPRAATVVAERHATDFLASRNAELTRLLEIGFDPIIIAPFDAELFGHWWFEGPLFLEAVIRQAAANAESALALTTPSDFLANHPTQQVIAPAASSWGENGHSQVWLDQANAWIYPHLQAGARRMTALARTHEHTADAQIERVLRQLARELLLAQSSDWPFLIKGGQAADYARQRVRDHLLRFHRLHDDFVAGRTDEAFLAGCEWRDNIFPHVEWRYFA